MKKLTTLLVMLLFTVGMAIGQNNASIEQIDDAHSGTVDQVGYDNNANLFQEGATTGGGQWGLGHDGTISQVGDENNANVSQELTLDGGRAIVDQLGDENTSFILQTGNQYDTGIARTIQQGNGNFARQAQNSVYGSPGDRRAVIEQNGDENRAVQEQSHSGGGGDIVVRSFQTGNDNISRQEQSGSTGSKFSLIEQLGDLNIARTFQTGIGVSHNATINQNGNSNVSRITQSN